MNNPPSEIEHLQHLVSNLRRDLQNALMQSRRRGEVIEKCKVALGSNIEGANFYFWITTQFPATQGNLKLIEWRERQTDALTAIEALEKEGLSNE